MSNLADSGSFICSPELMLKSDPALFERLDKVRKMNKESYYKRFPEQRPPTANMNHHSDVVKTLDMTDPTDN